PTVHFSLDGSNPIINKPYRTVIKETQMTRPVNAPASIARIGRLAALSAVSALALSACATPNLGPAPTPRAAGDFAAAQSFAAPPAEWPADAWWTAYGDAQLTGLIDEGLAGAPDLVQAQARVRKAEALAEQAG